MRFLTCCLVAILILFGRVDLLAVDQPLRIRLESSITFSVVTPDSPPLIRLYRRADAPHVYTTLEGVWEGTEDAAPPMVNLEEGDSLVFLGADQTPSDLMKEFGTWVSWWPDWNLSEYGARNSLSISTLNRNHNDELVVRDAVGTPIVGADVTLTLTTNPIQKSRVEISGFKSDPNGQIPISASATRSNQHHVRLRHEDYGDATVAYNGAFAGKEGIRFPLIRFDSPLVERAARGRVLHADGTPAVGALISPMIVEMLAGATSPLYFGNDARGPSGTEVRTNQKGEFRIYPQQGHAGVTGELKVPRGSGYFLVIREADLRSRAVFELALDNVSSRDILLEDRGKDYQIEFQRADGERLADELAEEIFLSHREEGITGLARSYPPELHRQAIRMSEGTLEATYRGAVTRLVFASIDITSRTPELVVLRESRITEIRGRVVDARDGTPIEDALVIGSGTRLQNRLSLGTITSEDWQRAREAAKATRIGEELFPIRAVATTLSGPDGTFVLSIPNEGEEAQRVYAGSEGTLFWSKSASQFRNRVPGPMQIDLGDFHLIPAGMVRVEFDLADDELPYGVKSMFEMDQQHVPEWMTALLESTHRYGESWSMLADYSRKDRTLHFLMPSSIASMVFLEVGGGLAPKLLDTALVLNQGETRTFQVDSLLPTSTILVQVLDPAGRPVEGIPVMFSRYQHETLKRFPNPSSTISDGEGYAKFHVDPGSHGRLKLGSLHHNNAHLPLYKQDVGVEFDFREHIDEVNMLEIRMTEENIEALREELRE